MAIFHFKERGREKGNALNYNRDPREFSHPFHQEERFREDTIYEPRRWSSPDIQFANAVIS
jgi:hypothetical protein